MSLASHTYPRLLGDIGGTHARFAWAAAPEAPITEVATYKCAEHPQLEDAITHYLREHRQPAPAACAIGIANPVLGDEVRMTNHHWSFSISGLRRRLSLQAVKVVNDFTALALSLPALQSSDLHPVGRGQPVAGAPMALIGPGTGLGVSGLFAAGDGRFIPVAGEGGHGTLAAFDDEEAEVLARLRQRFGHVSAERALSGPGLVNLYQAAAQIDGAAPEPLSPEAVVRQARERQDRHCLAAIDLFFRFLGGCAGNVALTLGARGGVYIGGGIVPALMPELATSRLRERFEAKGRFQAYLADLPLYVINARVSPALVGASRALDLGL